jgi:murein DD-endopeptidase MepM/ murein hydrolase activator NlpD
MISRCCLAAIVIALGVAPAPAAAPQEAAGLVLEASHRSGALHPGDVTLVVVAAPETPRSIDGDAFGRAIPFWPADVPGEWHALVGIGLDTPAGTYDLTVTATSPTGVTGTARLPLRIQDKAFATRQLRVASRFVDPPAGESERIAKEAALLASLFTPATERLWRGPFVPPVPGNATSSFGRVSVFNGEPRGRHQGADFSASTGTPIRAPNAGRVVLAMDLYFSGNTVVLDHGAGLYSLFAHLSRIDVKDGGLVATGDVLGAAGATGRVTGPHLHWAVRLGGQSVDPLSLMATLSNLQAPPTAVAAR